MINTLSDKGVTPIIVGAKDRWPLLGWYSYLAQRIGGVDLYNEVCSGDKISRKTHMYRLARGNQGSGEKGLYQWLHVRRRHDGGSLVRGGRQGRNLNYRFLVDSDLYGRPGRAKDFSYFPFPVAEGGKRTRPATYTAALPYAWQSAGQRKNKDAVVKFLKVHDE